MDACVTELLKELVRFQDRMYQKDPVKAKTKRRLVLGLREVLKHLKLRKLKCVIISPNCEKIQSKGKILPGLPSAPSQSWHCYVQSNWPLVLAGSLVSQPCTLLSAKLRREALVFPRLRATVPPPDSVTNGSQDQPHIGPLSTFHVPRPFGVGSWPPSSGRARQSAVECLDRPPCSPRSHGLLHCSLQGIG